MQSAKCTMEKWRTMSTSTRVDDIIRTVERLAGHRINSDEGVEIGEPTREVKNAMACWMASRDALQAAESGQADLVVTHESLFYPYDARLTPGETQAWESWPTNRGRREIIERAQVTVVRIHGSADEICIFDTFASLLGLGDAVAGEGYHKVYEIDPVSLRELVQRVKEAVGMAHLRVSCAGVDLEKRVRRVGLPWGGLGLFVNVSYQEWALEQGCDVLISGESDSYGFRFAVECGVPMIETSHEASEIPGLRRFTNLLAEEHPSVNFTFYDNGSAWRWM